MVNSFLVRGRVMHARLGPVGHAFQYPVLAYLFDLDDLPVLDQTLGGFGYNRFRPVSLWDRDYLRGGAGPMKERLLALLKERGCADGVERTLLITSARWFGYVFNPVSFFLALRGDGTLRATVAEVANTFGEAHLYVLHTPAGDGAWPVRYEFAKAFHVSPFFDRSGTYAFTFGDPREGLDVTARLFRDGEEAFRARLWGPLRPLGGGTLLSAALRHPLTAALTMPRILWQASKLYYRRKLPFHPKPEPASPDTFIKGREPLLQRLATSPLLARAGALFDRSKPHDRTR
jgi:cyclopropane-fatty-acyl-phospholipid synthase